MISSVETKSVTLFAPFCYFVYTIYITLLLLNSRTLSECMCLVFWTTTLSKCTFEIGQVNIYNFYLNMSDFLLPYPLILFKFSLSDIIFIWFVLFLQDNCITLTKNKTLFLVFFLTGSAQKVLSMELVPHNSKKTTKYTGSAQYIKNGKVSQRSSNHLFLRHYAGERFSQVSSLKW